MNPNPLAAYVPLNILIVDDDPFLAKLSAHHYRELGFTVEVATDGKEALVMMERSLPNITLCDRNMPELSGSMLLEIIRSRDAKWQKMVFVFVTGLADRRDRLAMIDLHPDGYLCKPLNFEQDDAELARILARKLG